MGGLKDATKKILQERRQKKRKSLCLPGNLPIVLLGVCRFDFGVVFIIIIIFIISLYVTTIVYSFTTQWKLNISLKQTSLALNVCLRSSLKSIGFAD